MSTAALTSSHLTGGGYGALPQGVAVVRLFIEGGVSLLPYTREAEEDCEQPLVPSEGLVGEFTAFRGGQGYWHGQLGREEGEQVKVGGRGGGREWTRKGEGREGEMQA